MKFQNKKEEKATTHTHTQKKKRSGYNKRERSAAACSLAFSCVRASAAYLVDEDGQQPRMRLPHRTGSKTAGQQARSDRAAWEEAATALLGGAVLPGEELSVLVGGALRTSLEERGVTGAAFPGLPCTVELVEVTAFSTLLHPSPPFLTLHAPSMGVFWGQGDGAGGDPHALEGGVARKWQGRMELEETLMLWKGESHVNGWFDKQLAKNAADVSPNTFMDKFYSGGKL